jgi:hypothetical protein
MVPAGAAALGLARAAPEQAHVAAVGAQAHLALREGQGLEPVLALAREPPALARMMVLALEPALALAEVLAGALAAYRRDSIRRVRGHPLRLANRPATRLVQAGDPGSFTTCARIRTSCTSSPGNTRRSLPNW